jgi:multicomponent Na+:H+ antiporter subunit E
MNLLMVNIALALIWAALTGRFEPSNLMVGFLLGFLILWVSRRAFGNTNYFFKVPQLIGFIIYFIFELLVANIRVAYRILMPLENLQPRVIAVPLDTCDDLEITLLASLISLTPGTLSLDVSKEKCFIYVHTMNADDPDVIRRQIKEGFERRLLRLTRGRAQTSSKESA